MITSVKDVLTFDEYLTRESQMIFCNLSCPSFVAGKAVPKDLNHLSIGQLLRLRNVSQESVVFVFCKEILGLSRKRIERAKASDVLPFVFWAGEQLKSINNKFASCKIHYTPEEIQAGIKKLGGTSFGLIDWYARRMGYTDQNEVMNVPWIRVWQCLEIDTNLNIYQRKLQDIYIQKSKIKH